MIYLVLAMITSMLVSVFMRLSEKYCNNNMAILASNYLMCTVLSAFLAGNLLPAGDGLPLTLGLGFINGFLFLSGFLLLKWNISRNGVVLPATFMRLGVIVPTIMSIAAFGEKPDVMQILGIIMAIVAIFIMNGKGGEARSILGLVLIMLAGGSADSMSKVFEEIGPQAMKDQFLLYTFFTAFVVCVIVCLVKKQKPAMMDVAFGALIGIPNYLSTRFLLWALKDVPAVIAYPSYSVGTIVLVMLVGVIAFKERLGKRKLIALAVILAALILLNI